MFKFAHSILFDILLSISSFFNFTLFSKIHGHSQAVKLIRSILLAISKLRDRLIKDFTIAALLWHKRHHYRITFTCEFSESKKLISSKNKDQEDRLRTFSSPTARSSRHSQPVIVAGTPKNNHKFSDITLVYKIKYECGHCFESVDWPSI